MINSIITELQTIANAFTSVESFIYNRPSAVNWKDRTKGYPCILVDSLVDIEPVGQNKSNLIKTKNYTTRIFAFDEFSITEQSTTTLSAKQHELETILDQYIAEIKRRTQLDITKNFLIAEINSGLHVFPVHNDKLIQVSFQVTFTANSHCTTGTFNY